MKRTVVLMPALAALAFVLAGHAPTQGQMGQTPPPTPPKKFEDIDKVVQGAKAHEGLFKLWQKDEQLYAEIKETQLERPYLLPIAVARGMGLGGYTLNFDEQWVILFKRVHDKIHVVRRNVRFRARSDSPTAKAVETTYTDSVLMALKIHGTSQIRQSVLISFNDLFMNDFADLGLGFFDASRSSWHKVKTFPRNVEVQLSATYGGRRWFSDDSVIDPRGTTVVLHYGLCELPDSGYQPRLADDRVGHFLSVVKDFTRDDKDTSYVRFVNRWCLERAEPEDPKKPGKLSPPKKKIVFWIEKSVPHEYRNAVREGILEWNKAFEKIGFRDAIEVRQQENEDFDPEDINYNTFRWITTDGGFAMGPSRANPLTGEIIDADIIFDASMIRYLKMEYRASSAALKQDILSVIEAARRGLDLPFQPEETKERGQGEALGWSQLPRFRQGPADPRVRAVRAGLCMCAAHRRAELGLASLALAARGLLKDGEKVPEELIQQSIKEIVMHEVGHTLGLRHNFKASTMLKNEQLHDTSITRKQGLVGSVMDYSPINLAPKGVKQGDYFTTTIGPYDYWAIEYAYKPLTGGTEGEWEKLQEIAKKGAAPGHDYGTDEDMFSTSDPLINTWDLGADPMKFGQDRIALAEELLKSLADKVVDKGEGYQRLRLAFDLLLRQYADAGFLAAQFVGGELAHRDHRGDPNERDPFVPVKADKQREALQFLQKHLLTDKPFQFSPKLLRKLAADRWMHWGNDFIFFQSVDYPLHQRILSIQRIALRILLDPATLRRIQNNASKVDSGEKPLSVAEVFRALSDAIWGDGAMTPTSRGNKKILDSSVITRNLQREYVTYLSNLVLRGAGVPDARSLARFHLRTLDRRLQALLSDKNVDMDDTVRAHLEEVHERVAKVLNASMNTTQP